MADYKVGLDYFELNCQLEEKVRLIQAEFGLKGFAIVVKLYQKIYGELGYYCEWSEDSLLLFMSENGLSCDNKNFIQEVVSACIRRNIFSEKLFNDFGILTSCGVQKRYMKATSRREKVSMKKEYLLLDDGKINPNVDITELSVDIIKENACRIGQRRVEKSREENKNNMCIADANALFEKLWKLYPVKRGKGQVSDAKKMKLMNIGYDEMARAIGRYERYVDSIDYLHYQNGSTFFNSGYVDYLDGNYTKPTPTKTKNRFNNFPQRDYDDINSIEKKLLSNNRGD